MNKDKLLRAERFNSRLRPRNKLRGIPAQIKSWFQSISNEVKKNKPVYLGLLVVLAAGLFVRVYRTDQILGFYYDQGRDALVIWEFIHRGKLFLIGPVTGIEGIFRGPWYYWLIVPFYLVGRGDPVWPAVFLAFTTAIALFMAFHLARKMAGNLAGLIAATIASFSFYLVIAARWLSNPTPMLLISMILVWSLFQILEGKRWAWIVTAFILGMAVQFGSAAEIFYFPAIFLFAVWQRKNLPDRKIALLSAASFFITVAPQMVFDIKHDGVLSSAIKRFLFQEDSFKLSFWEVVKVRLSFYWQVFASKIFPLTATYQRIFAVTAAVSLLVQWRLLFTNKRFIVPALLFVAPLFGMLFFQGNRGNVYDYYFTGYYLVFVLLFSVLLALPAQKTWGKLLLFLFLFLFLQDNLPVIKARITAGVDGPTTIALGNELAAVDWVIKDAAGRKFNVDVYVPPVIPYAYDYLFLWQTTKLCGRSLCGMVVDQQIPLLYTLYEVDPPHPERLSAWLARQKGIGVVEESTQFGGITVERRKRQ